MSALGRQVDAGPGLSDRRKRAELTSALGAGVLGVGIGIFFSRVLSPYVLGFLVAGALSHALGMYQKHRLDSSPAGSTAPWIEWAYRICWVLLAGLAAYIVWDLA